MHAWQYRIFPRYFFGEGLLQREWHLLCPFIGSLVIPAVRRPAGPRPDVFHESLGLFHDIIHAHLGHYSHKNGTNGNTEYMHASRSGILMHVIAKQY